MSHPSKRGLASGVLALLAVLSAPATAAAATAPTVTTGPATAITQTTATLNGFVDDHGQTATYYFEYGTTKKYGAHTATGSLGKSNSTRPVAEGASGLRPETTYHFAIVAKSGGHTTVGHDRTFKTRPIQTQATINVSPNPVVFGGAVTVFGALVGPPAKDNAGKQVALQYQAWPFNSSFQQVGNTVVTDSQAAYKFILAPPTTGIAYDTRFRIVDVSQPSIVSPVVTEGVTPVVHLRAHRLRRLRRGIVARFEGRLRPAHNNIKILIQRRDKHGWRTVATLKAVASRNGSAFKQRVRLTHGPGTFRAVTQIVDGSGTDAASNVVRVR